MAYLDGFGAEGDHLRNRFNTLWVSGSPSTARTEIAWGNVNFTPPESASWVRFTVSHSGASLASVGTSPLHRYDGNVLIEVFAPANTGEGDIDALCDAAEAIFRDYRTQQGLRFDSPYTLNMGESGGWYKKDVMCPFVRDTVFS